MKVYIDYREKKSGVLNELIKHGINVEIKSLPIADYIITGNNQEGKFQEIGIERKTQTDFILDRRASPPESQQIQHYGRREPRNP